ncbi:hypothetical protein Dsin_007189 [Dipteronia sinensis]|uniref:Uncharacterized protein n=1 Tax=Dipteronia sinensis TaxID=43782 RepID=A0AAE0B027_9ROSI|nr:hypothetical protein Dsin_007189 [Dipteronia sinensis]
MDPSYTTWVLHGERASASLQYEDAKLTETYQMCKDQVSGQEGDVEGDECKRSEEEILNLVKNVEIPLYPGCTKYTRMSATIALFKHKATHGLSDNSFDELLQIIRDILPQENTLPDSLYSCKKLLKMFDLGYQKIHACPKDCCLFRKEFENTCFNLVEGSKNLKVLYALKANKLRNLLRRFKR